MSNFSRKAAAVGLAIATAAWFGGSVLSASAATTSDLQAQIAALLAQIQTLQAQLNAAQGNTTSSYTFSKDLTLGSKGADVKALQQFLNANGYTVAATGAGSKGMETEYFGPATKAALAKYQAAKGITPSVGYFGPKTRAVVNASAVVTPTPTPTPGPTAPASGLVVSVASNNPASGALISSASSAAARVPVLAVNLTAGTASGVTVTDLKFHKTGVVADSAISGAYLVQNGKVLYQYTSVNAGVVDFSGIALNIAAGQTVNLTLAIDPATNLSAGNTISFAMTGASDVTATDATNAAVTASGAFPLNGNTFTVTSVSNPSIASVTFASSSVGTTVYAGTTGVLASQWTATVNNSPVNLTSVNFKVVGSATKTDLKNVKFMVNGNQVGSTLASVASDGSAYFDFSASPVKLQTGSNNIQIYADIMGSPSFNFQFELLNSYDIYAVDTQYNVPVSVTVNGGSGVSVTINQGQITTSVDTATPTGNIALGGSGTTLAKFDIYAAGEAVKIKFLDVKLTKTGGTHNWNTASSAGFDTDLQNLRLVDDQGNQIGTTISTTGGTTSSNSGACTLTDANNVTCHFGTSGSPIVYTIPANTTRVISVRADVQTGADFTTVTASLPGNSSNLQGLTSSQTSSSGSATGSALTLSTTPLTVTKNGAFANQTYAKGASAVKIGSYVFTASSAEGVNVSNFTVSVNSSSTNFQNLKAMIGSTKVGSTYSTLSSGNYTFSGNNFAVPVGGTAVVDIYADILTTNTGAMGSVTSFVSCTGTGATTNTSVSCSGTPAGQTVTVSTGPTLTISNNNSGASRQVVLGSTGVSLGKILLTDTAGIEPIRLQEIKFNLNTGSSVGAAFTNLQLYDANGNAIAGAGPVSMTSAAPSFVADFNFGTAATLTVPQAGTLAVELRGNVAPFVVGGGSIENATTSIAISATSSVVAYGKSSNTSVTVTGTPSFATLTTLRSKLTLAGTSLGSDSACGSYTGGSTTARSRTTTDYVGCLKISADPSGQEVKVNTLSLRFVGGALSTASAFNVNLIDPSTGSAYDGSSQQSCTPTGNSCSVTFSFTGTPVSSGSTKGVAIKVDSSNYFVSANLGQSMDVNLNAATDVNWGDGAVSGSTANGLNLSSDVSVPLNLAHVTYTN